VFSHILSGMPYLLLLNKSFKTKDVLMVIPDFLLYYVVTHVKLMGRSKAVQLVDILAYESFTTKTALNSNLPKLSPTLIYYFHSVFSQEKLFIFTLGLKSGSSDAPSSIANLYSTSSWLEREVSEMYGVRFEHKKDLRNLMLQYGDTSAPFKKSYPSIGTKETFYDPFTDNLIQVPVTTQI